MGSPIRALSRETTVSFLESSGRILRMSTGYRAGRGLVGPPATHTRRLPRCIPSTSRRRDGLLWRRGFAPVTSGGLEAQKAPLVVWCEAISHSHPSGSGLISGTWQGIGSGLNLQLRAGPPHAIGQSVRRGFCCPRTAIASLSAALSDMGKMGSDGEDGVSPLLVITDIVLRRSRSESWRSDGSPRRLAHGGRPRPRC